MLDLIHVVHAFSALLFFGLKSAQSVLASLAGTHGRLHQQVRLLMQRVATPLRSGSITTQSVLLGSSVVPRAAIA